MIDGLIKSKIDPLWEAMSTPLVKAGFTPNQVTFAGLVLIVLASLAYLWHGAPLVYGLTLALSFAFDALDGAVARRRDMRSHAGGYFDAVVDRYQELAVLA
ncbi:CDP-alcohol phosphatidyltransferase family protein, partial [Shimia sp.]|uniref:CDP-alcohol phosphatidyltransferase family protein n=1 Tax=Shimia sp. TaxID=1954381 RepID=UPI0035631ACB